MNIKDNCTRFILLCIALLIVLIVPVRVLFRRHPFRNYVFTVAYQWLKVSTQLLKACGARCQITSNLK